MREYVAKTKVSLTQNNPKSFDLENPAREETAKFGGDCNDYYF